MTSVYLKCDYCGETLGAEEVIKNRTPTWNDFRVLQKEARKLGWTGRLDRDSDSDKCPACNRKEQAS